MWTLSVSALVWVVPVAPVGYPTDLEVTARVKSALVAELGSAGERIGVTTTVGVVALWGTTFTANERTRAEQVAATVAGVRRVQADVPTKPTEPAPLPVVTWSPPKAAAPITLTTAQKIAPAEPPPPADPHVGLQQLTDARYRNLRYTLADGVVTVEGQAAAPSVVMAWAEAAGSVPGVVRVRVGTVRYTGE